MFVAAYAVYKTTLVNNYDVFNLFATGLEFIPPIALGVAFLLSTSPFVDSDEKFIAIASFVLTTVAGMAGLSLFDLTTFGVIINTFFIKWHFIH